MSSVNKVILVGNVGKDPEIRTSQSGARFANLSLATSDSWKEKATGERKENTQWHKVSIFNTHLVDFVERFVTKGTKLYVEGQLETRKWTDKEGKDNYTTEIVLSSFKGDVKILSPMTDSERKPVVQKPDPQDRPTVDLDSDIPF